MSLMNSRAVLEAAKVGSMDALWARIDAGTFPIPVAFGGLRGVALGFRGGPSGAIEIKPAPDPKPEPKKREKQQPPSRTRERKDPRRTETRESE